MKKILFILLLSSISFFQWSCEAPDPYQNSVSSTIEMSKTACFGSCPVYDIRIDGKGNATYEGVQFVKKEGKYSAIISPDSTNQLFQAFIEGDFEAFQDEYTDNISDLPTTYLTFTHSGQTKKVKDYYGAPEKLKNLEKMVEEFVDAADWKKQ